MLISAGFSDALVRKTDLKEEDLSTAYLYSLSVGIVCYIIMLFINTWYTGKYYHFGFKEQIKDLLPILALSFMAFLSVISFIQFIHNMLPQIFIGGLFGSILYICGAYLFKFKELDEIKF